MLFIEKSELPRMAKRVAPDTNPSQLVAEFEALPDVQSVLLRGKTIVVTFKSAPSAETKSHIRKSCKGGSCSAVNPIDAPTSVVRPTRVRKGQLQSTFRALIRPYLKEHLMINELLDEVISGTSPQDVLEKAITRAGYDPRSAQNRGTTIWGQQDRDVDEDDGETHDSPEDVNYPLAGARKWPKGSHEAKPEQGDSESDVQEDVEESIFASGDTVAVKGNRPLQQVGWDGKVKPGVKGRVTKIVKGRMGDVVYTVKWDTGEYTAVSNAHSFLKKLKENDRSIDGLIDSVVSGTSARKVVKAMSEEKTIASLLTLEEAVKHRKAPKGLRPMMDKFGRLAAKFSEYDTQILSLSKDHKKMGRLLKQVDKRLDVGKLNKKQLQDLSNQFSTITSDFEADMTGSYGNEIKDLGDLVNQLGKQSEKIAAMMRDMEADLTYQ